MEEPSGGDSGSVSPLRSSLAAAFYLLFRGFCVSLPPRGTIFTVGFRSRRSHGDEDRRHRSHEGEKGVPHASWYRGRVGPPHLVLVAPIASILRL